MHVHARFRLHDEATDTPRITAQLAGLRVDLERAGFDLEMLGADVTLYYCEPCDYAQAEFAYPDEP